MFAEESMIEDPWKPFQETVQAPLDRARAWKEKTGRKVVGHILPDVPEEIIHAAGALPVAIEGAGAQVSQAATYIPGYTCSHAMGAFELGISGDLDVLDGMVIPYVCDTTRNLFHIWDQCFPKMNNEFLRLPKRLDYAGARDYLYAEFVRFFEAMRKLTGSDAGTEKLAASVSLYDSSRERLRQAYRMQIEGRAGWTMERVHAVFAAAFRAPREDHLAWMEALPWNAERDDSVTRVPLYVRGKVWDPPDLLGLMDQLGLLVVGDEIITGHRSVELDAGSGGDALEALVQRHLNTVAYTGYHLEPGRLVRSFVGRVTASQAKGVIFVNPKFCEAAAFDTPDLQKALDAASIPNLILETSARGVSLSQIRLRLEAFREMLAGDLP